MSKRLTLLFIVLATVSAIQAQSIFGKWKTIDDATGEPKSIVEITERDAKVYGKVIELLNPAMKEMKCQDCPNLDKDKPVLGLEVLKGLSKDGNKYSNGQILDPSNGKLYKCTATLDGTDKLKVRGYIGFSAFGRNQIWHRVK